MLQKAARQDVYSKTSHHGSHAAIPTPVDSTDTADRKMKKELARNCACVVVDEIIGRSHGVGVMSRCS